MSLGAAGGRVSQYTDGRGWDARASLALLSEV